MFINHQTEIERLPVLLEPMADQGFDHRIDSTGKTSKVDQTVDLVRMEEVKAGTQNLSSRGPVDIFFDFLNFLIHLLPFHPFLGINRDMGISEDF